MNAQRKLGELAASLDDCSIAIDEAMHLLPPADLSGDIVDRLNAADNAIAALIGHVRRLIADLPQAPEQSVIDAEIDRELDALIGY